MGETSNMQGLINLIGVEVTYIRHHHKEGVMQGAGRVKAFGLDPEKRIIALIQDAERVGPDGKAEVFNVPARCVNPSPEYVEAFTALVGNVKAVETEANLAARQIVDEANAKIGRMQDEVLGEPVAIED